MSAAPPGALTWASPAERNRKLIPWRRAISQTFAERPRCLRVAWALDHLFNAKTGYAYPTNADIANMIGLPGATADAQGGVHLLQLIWTDFVSEFLHQHGSLPSGPAAHANLDPMKLSGL